MAKNLSSEKDIVEKFLDAAQSYYDAYKSDRDEIDDECEAADYMYKAAQNRSFNTGDKTKGANTVDNERANVGSTLFFRMCNQRAAVGASVTLSKDQPFNYDPIINEKIFGSAEEGESIAAQMNVLAKWTMKKDSFKQKAIEFWSQLAKYSNIPVMISWNEEKATRRIKQTKPIVELDMFGVEQVMGYEDKITNKRVTINAHPTLRVLPWSMLYADRYIGDLNKSNCVILCSYTNMADIAAGVDAGFYDKDQYEVLKSDKTAYVWDGTSGSEFRQKQQENQDRTFSASKSNDLFPQWDIYMRVPIDKDKWEEDEPAVWYWATVFGNSIDRGITLRLERNPDPDDEVPVKMIHLVPDDSDTIYHVMLSQILRSNYSVECTLKGMVIDNIAMRNTPPIMGIEGAHTVRDFRMRKGAYWPVERMDAIRAFEIPDTTQNTSAVLKLIEEDSMRAANLGRSQMDEFAGARTSASEAIAVNRHSMEPQMMQVRYVLEQLLPWYARKIKSYWENFASAEQIVRISDDKVHPQVVPKDIYGEFDVEVNIVDEYEDSMVQQQKLTNVIMTLAQAPQLLQSETHSIDMGALVRKWLEKMHIGAIGGIVKPPMGIDAKEVAELENKMLLNGQWDEPQQGENHNIHMSTHKAFRLRYKGIEDTNPNIQFLDEHIALTQQLMQQEGMQGGGGIATGPENQTEGEVAGNDMAAMLGGMV